MLCVSAGSTAIAKVPQPSPLATDERIVLPEAGMAVTMPAGWEVRTDHGGAIFETALSASPSGAPGQCAIQVFRYDGATTQEVAEFVASHYWDLRGGTMENVRLPSAGDAVKVVMLGGPSAVNGKRVAYVFDAGDYYAWLWCDSTGSPPPDDLWLSIADTIEFLPAEE
jgi:hypothetical protein